ncbi:MAG: NAD-dependent epimerase/dehydratase family protein [Deltaproteobacteria bacterium]|nr:NAD-dependent epimerase/dehydratase family protein [Deltaproteobacteria bacterium]
MTTALVTGASGFLGARIVARLQAEGVRVRALVRSGRPSAADERIEGDLRDDAVLARAVAGCDWVIHAGARVATTGEWEEFEATNVRATEALIAAATAAGVGRVVHVSSLSVYAVPHDGATVTEESPYDDGGGERGFYARSKLAADKLARAAIERGAPLTIIRPGLLYGPGNKPPLARRAVALGPLRVLLASRDYLLPLAYVDNVADAIALAARAEIARGRAYTIVDVHARQADYARTYREVGGQRWFPFYPPLSLLRLAVTGAERGLGMVGRKSPISRHQVERTLRSATFVTFRAQNELGWYPRVPITAALRRSFAAVPAAAVAASPAPAQSLA